MLSTTIHVARPDLINLGEHVDFKHLNSSLEEAMRGATTVEVLGGYYSVERTLALLKKAPRAMRASCKVRMAVGLDAAIKIRDCWDDMRALETDLRKAGFRNVALVIVPGRPHFHTKLFHFLRRTHHVWFVGSANPGSERHELMVSFTGKHDALRDYIEAVFDSGQPVTKQPPSRQLPSTLREFFLTGSLIHKVPQQAPFTFDAFRLGPEDREKMMRALTTAIVPHARPKAQGFSFSLRSAVGNAEFGEDNSDDAGRVQLRRFTVDTILGSWAPRRYGEEIEGQLRSSEELRIEDLKRFAARISGDGELAVRSEFARYVSSMEEFLASIAVEIRSVENRDVAFNRFLKSRQKMLADEEGVRRLAQRLQIAEMPDIWYDEKAARNFEDTFFDDIAFRMSAAAASKIIRSITEGIGISKATYLAPRELLKALRARLEKRSWKDDEWILDV